MINKTKLIELLSKLKKQFDFDVEIVANAIMKAAPARSIVTKEQLADLVASEIDRQMNLKAKAVSETKNFEDPHQEAGAIAIVVGKNVGVIKNAFLELMKNEDLTMLLQNDGLLVSKDMSMRMRY